VLEKYISAIAPKAIIDYCNGGRYLTEDLRFEEKRDGKRKVEILKVHGRAIGFIVTTVEY